MEKDKKPKLVTKSAFELMFGYESNTSHEYGLIWRAERKRGYKSKYYVRDEAARNMGEI